jgi:hypothetical protein
LGSRLVGLLLFVAVTLLLPAWSEGAATEPLTVTVSPERVTRDATTSLTLTLPSPPKTGNGLKDVQAVLIGSQSTKPLEPKDATAITVRLKIESSGSKAVLALSEQNTLIARGELTVVDGATDGCDWCVGGQWVLALLYVGLLVAFAWGLMHSDLTRAYRFKEMTRDLILGKFSPDKLSLDQLKLLLPDLEQPPPGIPGLTRGTLALTLLLLLGIAIAHVLVVAPRLGHELPPVADKLLTILASALTSITAFYFGSRAAETAQQTAAATQARTSAQTPPDDGLAVIASITPSNGPGGAQVVITGRNFGPTPGSVKFGDTAATQPEGANWSDSRIVVTVPATVGLGRTTITITTAAAAKVTSAAGAFEVKPFSVTPSQGKMLDAITLRGHGFGDQPGSVTFGSATSGVIPTAQVLHWGDDEIRVTVPAGLTPGPTAITVTPRTGSPMTRGSDAFTVTTQ